MPPDLPYQIPLAGLAAIIVLYFLIRSWTYGVLRPILTVMSLGAGGAAGYFAFKNAKHFLAALKFEPEPISTVAFAFVAGAAVFFVLRIIGHKISEAVLKPDTFLYRCLAGAFGAALSLIPALLLITALATGLRIYATFAEFRHIETCSTLYSSGETAYPATPYTVNLRNALEKIPRASEFLDRFDPYSEKATRTLTGLALISRNYDLFLRLGNHRLAVEIYTQPDVADLLQLLEVTRPLDDRDYRRLLTNAKIRKTAAIPEITGKLEYLDLIEVLNHALGVP